MRFYVYQFVDEAGVIQYVGKGSGNRIRIQRRRFATMTGTIVSRHKRECDAFKCEAKLISEHAPAMNKNAGGWGGKVKRKDQYQRRPSWSIRKSQDACIELLQRFAPDRLVCILQRTESNICIEST